VQYPVLIPIRHWRGFSIPDARQISCSSRSLFAHGDRHLDTGERVLVDAARLGIAKEDHNGVADIFIDCRSVLALECDG
jgi:hypothetical protein